MTDVRTNSRDAKVELDRHLEEAENANPGKTRTQHDREDELGNARRELADLRSEVADLRARLTAIRTQTDSVSVAQSTEDHPWLRIGATMLATFVLGKLVQRLRLGAPGAAAVPLIAAQIDRRLW